MPFHDLLIENLKSRIGELSNCNPNLCDGMRNDDLILIMKMLDRIWNKVKNLESGE